ncbi:MAG TPA: adenosylcobinamide-GDP ribazoletransferase [Trebonia sp.]
MRSWRTAVSLFTAIPFGGEAELGEGEAARAVLWLPAVGLLLGLAGAVVMLGVEAGGSAAPRRLLGAVLAVALIALATGGLHLDGLADTADGLGSRRAPVDALAIMSRSDVGPMGVAALVLVLLIQVCALAAVPRASVAAAALVLAEVTGRVAVVVATGSPAARPGGFGALVAGQTTARARALIVAGFGCAVACVALAAGAAGLTADGAGLAARGLGAALSGLVGGWLLQRVARRRFGGMTGDVFGAILEVSAATVLVACVLLS